MTHFTPLFFSFTFVLFATFSSVHGGCEDGVDNVIEIHDLLPEAESSVRFNGVKIHTYGPDAKPMCKPTLHFPGFIKIAEGEIDVINPLDSGDDDLTLHFSVEQNSFMVGKVCENGKSRNSFVPDEVCSISLCKLAPELCKIVGTERTLTKDDLPEDQRGLISIGPIALSVLEGEWKASAKILHNNKVQAAIRVGDKKKWVSIKLGDEHDTEVFKKMEQKLGITSGGNGNGNGNKDNNKKEEL